MLRLDFEQINLGVRRNEKITSVNPSIGEETEVQRGKVTFGKDK